MANLPNPKRTYVAMDVYSVMLIPMEHIALFKDVVMCDKEYVDRQYIYKPKKSSDMAFTLLDDGTVASIVATAKLEGS
jgi:non-homologous end joining protein Ku